MNPLPSGSPLTWLVPAAHPHRVPATLRKVAAEEAVGHEPPYVDLSESLRVLASVGLELPFTTARAFGPRWIRATGLFPLQWEGEAPWLVTEWPMTPLGQRYVNAIGEPVSLLRTSPQSLKASLRDLFGLDGPEDGSEEERLAFGQWAISLGKASAREVVEAVAQQRRQGGRIGEILVGLGALSSKDVAEILSRQLGLPFCDLTQGLQASAEKALEQIWALFPETYWRHHRVVPVEADEQRLVLAMEDPLDVLPLRALSQAAHRVIQPVVTGHRDIEAALDRRFASRNLQLSKDLVRVSYPEWSADHLLSKGQRRWGLSLLALFLAATASFGTAAFTVLSSLFAVLYAVLVGYRWWMIDRAAGMEIEQAVSEELVRSLPDRELPVYTILIPARDEAAVIPSLAEALARLDWPKDRLDVKLLLEADDLTTIEAARQARLPAYVDLVIVPPSDPRTKPKACNFGLLRARGEFLTIFDAEDIPDPLELKKAYSVFRAADPKLACVQAKLTYFNWDQNWLTRWFTTEYATWFDLYLPAIYAAGHPIPLGGTSNHFRTSVLRELGGWDAYNVTEDADLGIRLYRAGYWTAIIDAYTEEEANSELVNWVRQRSRWIKGYLQTWLVHMRHPKALWREVGPTGFWGVHAALLGTVLPFLLNPLYWLLTTLWFMTHWSLVPQLFPPGIYYVGMINLLIGNFLFTYMNALAVARRQRWELVKYSLLMPLYWGMMSVAAWKALLQLISRPSHWEKTQHGLTFRPSRAEAPLLAPVESSRFR